mmetsp:Transcript_11336/g.24393  ORF Transcript_11336/g.24393 Transcript_11336/m.24393 type:complete len:211 (-) Transcript_11336:897-1529(-)
MLAAAALDSACAGTPVGEVGPPAGTLLGDLGMCASGAHAADSSPTVVMEVNVAKAALVPTLLARRSSIPAAVPSSTTAHDLRRREAVPTGRVKGGWWGASAPGLWLKVMLLSIMGASSPCSMSIAAAPWGPRMQGPHCTMPPRPSSFSPAMKEMTSHVELSASSSVSLVSSTSHRLAATGSFPSRMGPRSQADTWDIIASGLAASMAKDS